MDSLLSLAVFFFVSLAIAYLIIFLQYRKTEYYKLTKNPLLRVRSDKGLLGEYLISKKLTPLKGTKRFLFNVYIPKDEESTTEIDVIMIRSSGIYVFESKNYSGWIFGTETQKNWTQSLSNGRKSKKIKFYNPIFQNKAHINALTALIPPEFKSFCHSYIVFSERCELKHINLTTNLHEVIKRDKIFSRISFFEKKQESQLNDEQIEQLFQLLYPYSQVDDNVKEKHIEDIKNKNPKINAKHYLKNNHSTTTPASTPAPVQICDLETAPLCPKCGKQISKRTASKGEREGKVFWGCTGFPKCRYILNIEDENQNE